MSGEVPTARLGAVVINCNDLERVVAFWKELLGRGERSRFPGFVFLEPDDRGTSLAFQQVPETKQGPNRMHIDFGSTDREGFVARIVALGGSRIDDHQVGDFHWTIVADPEENEFCIGDMH